MSLYAAFDLHSNSSVLAVVDDAGGLRYRRRLPNDLPLIDATLAPFRDELRGVAVEFTYNAYWLIDGLQSAGYPAQMVNTLAVPQYAVLKHGDDDSDARSELKQHPVLHADETPVAMLDPGAGKTKRSYLFAYAAQGWASAAGGRMPGAARTGSGPPIVVFEFYTSRSGEHARRFLGGHQGALMVDDYSGYKALFANGVTELGCWAQARRKFYDLQAASGSPIAGEAIARIAALYRVEADAKSMTADARHAHRQQHALPYLQTRPP